MRRHDEAVDLLVAVVGEREHGPVLAGFAGAHLDAPHDGVGAGRGRNLDAVAFGVLQVDGISEIDGRRIGAHVDGLDRARGGNSGSGDHRQSDKGTAEPGGAQKCQQSPSRAGSRRRSRHHGHTSPGTIANRLCAEFTAAGFPNAPKPLRHKALVTFATAEGKDIAVYFQRLRVNLAGHFAAGLGRRRV